MAFRMRAATAGGGVIVGCWCGGIYLMPGSADAEHALSAEPIYLDSEDLLRLFVFAADEFGAVEVLHEDVVKHAAAWLQKRLTVVDHDRVMDYWDQRP